MDPSPRRRAADGSASAWLSKPKACSPARIRNEKGLDARFLPPRRQSNQAAENSSVSGADARPASGSRYGRRNCRADTASGSRQWYRRRPFAVGNVPFGAGGAIGRRREASRRGRSERRIGRGSTAVAANFMRDGVGVPRQGLRSGTRRILPRVGAISLTEWPGVRKRGSHGNVSVRLFRYGMSRVPALRGPEESRRRDDSLRTGSAAHAPRSADNFQRMHNRALFSSPRELASTRNRIRYGKKSVASRSEYPTRTGFAPGGFDQNPVEPRKAIAAQVARRLIGHFLEERFRARASAGGSPLRECRRNSRSNRRSSMSNHPNDDRAPFDPVEKHAGDDFVRELLS